MGLEVWADLRPRTSSQAVTDKLRAYGAASSQIGLSARHEQGWRKNNRAENSRQPTRRREAQDAAFRPDFCLIFAPCGYDDPEILPTREPRPVSKALMTDTPPRRDAHDFDGVADYSRRGASYVKTSTASREATVAMRSG
jgi:hypothetical protein